MASGIVHFRVDDRMLHGIIATQWLPQFNITRAMVVDDAAAGNDMMRMTIKMACPGGTALSVLTVDKAANNINAGNYSRQKVFTIFRSIESAYALFKKGVDMPQLNLGDVTQNTGDVTVLNKTVRVNASEKAMLREMRNAGVKITCRFAIQDPEIDCSGMLD